MNYSEALNEYKMFGFFEDICKIPRGSGNTAAIADYLCDFAKTKKLDYIRDNADNVIIKKAGSKGCEAIPPVILQGHTDMVCESVAESPLNPETDGVKLISDGDFLKADKTTLGADDGAAVAIMLAILDSDEMTHPPIEAVFTSDEEIGLLGAAAIDCGNLKGKRMINLDSEDEGIFTVSCAGGNRTSCRLPVKRTVFGGTRFVIRVYGLAGGHSGTEIGKGRGNANIIIGRILNEINRKTNMGIIKVDGGLRDNVIPTEAYAEIMTENFDEAKKICMETEEVLRHEFGSSEPDFRISLLPSESTAPPLCPEDCKKVISLLLCMPNGVLEYSRDIEGLVQTSLNLGILKTETDAIYAKYSVRSSLKSQKKLVSEKLALFMEQLGGSTAVSGDYPAWEYRKNSYLRDLLSEVFIEQYGYEPKIEAIHAGLECGIFYEKIKTLDCISIGPDIKDIHTPSERLSISSAIRLWNLLCGVLEKLTN